MRAFKIIIGFLILYSSGIEYINASKQVFSFFDPSIIIISLLMLVLCAWLLGSGISNQKLNIKSWKFARYYGATFLTFLVIAFISIFTFRFEPDIVKVNGIDVDIAEFMNGTKRIVSDEQERRAYCICVVTKLTANKEVSEKYKSEFASGKFSKVIETLQASPSFADYKLNECANSLSDIEWTTGFESGLRANLMKELNASNLSKTNDINKYCDCLVEGYKKIPIQKLSTSDFQQSPIARNIDSLCNATSQIK